MKLNNYETGAVAGVPAALGAPSVGNPTNGDAGGGIPATTPGERWFYQLQEEIRHLIEDVGELVPDDETLTQLADAISNVYVSQENPVVTAADDLDDFLTSGFYRTNALPINAPTGAAGGQIIVSSGTPGPVLQIMSSLIGGRLWFRVGNSPTGVFYDWKEISTSDPDPVGAEMFWPGDTAPTNWLEEDGSLRTLTSYEGLWDELNKDYGKGAGTTFTAANATEILTSAAHGLVNGDIIFMLNSGGALPTGFVGATKYYVISATTNTFQLSDTLGGAAIDITDDGTGTHSFYTQFRLPDPRGRVIRVLDNAAGVDPDAAGRTDRGDGTTGDNVGTNQADELKSHLHAIQVLNELTGAGLGSNMNNSGSADQATKNTGGNETRMINTYRMMIIKYQ